MFERLNALGRSFRAALRPDDAWPLVSQLPTVDGVVTWLGSDWVVE